MNEEETKEEGYFLVPKAWLHAIAEKQDRILSLMEKSSNADAANCIGEYISEEEAKRQVGRKTTWFWSLRTTGQLPFSKVGKKIFYLKNDIKKLLERNTKDKGQDNNPTFSKAA